MYSDENEQIRFNHKKFFGIIKLGFTDDGHFVVCLFTTPNPKPRGSYFTTIPISNWEYRSQYKSKTFFTVNSTRTIIIFDDWGTPYTITAKKKVIDNLIDDCTKNHIPFVKNEDRIL